MHVWHIPFPLLEMFVERRVSKTNLFYVCLNQASVVYACNCTFSSLGGTLTRTGQKLCFNLFLKSWKLQDRQSNIEKGSNCFHVK